jgi:predicted dienelactone hydrolase
MVTPPRGAFARWIRRIGLGAVAAVLLLVIGLWVEHSLPVELPHPSGPFPVGRTSRTLGADIAAWIWYPARHAERVAPYLPDSVRERWAHDRPGVIKLLTRNMGRVRAHGVFDAPFYVDTARSPVILFRGGGGGGALGFTSHFEELASRGYVVVAIEGGTGGNPESCVGRADEDACATKLINGAGVTMGAAIDRLATISSSDPLLGGHLDLKTLGVFGHSFGGAQALAFCAADPRCTAGVNIDGRLFGSLLRSTVTVPFLWLLSDHGSAQDSVSRQIMVQIQSVYERQPTSSRMRIAIRGANHFTFSEDGALLKSGVLRGVMRVAGILGIGGRRQIEVSSYAVRSFFDAWLRHAGDAQAAMASAKYPEIIRVP